MKKIITTLFITSSLIASCSNITNPVLVTEAPFSHNNSKWMDEEDYVRYVNFISRVPSNVDSIYNITGDCDGYPAIDVKTAPGFCVGQIHNGIGLKKPRTAAIINDNSIVIADMGSWSPFEGQIVSLTFDKNKKTTLKEIFTIDSFKNPKDPRREIINRPHQIIRHTDGLYYVGTASGLLRFDILATNPIDTIEVLISNLPSEGLHPLKAFVFDDKNSIFINVGSASNVCHKNSVHGSTKKKSYECDEAEDLKEGQAQIRRYTIDARGVVSKTFEIYAKGLRNSVGLVWDSRNELLIQAENSRDGIDKYAPKLNGSNVPHDEINIIEKSKHYGWPYCYDNNLNSPEWSKMNCSGYTKPYLFLPAHAAPLALMFYQGTMFPKWYEGRLLSSFHGYHPKGHRIVSFLRDARGLPVGDAKSIVYDWDSKGEQNFGSPVGLTEMPDGSVIIIEDVNKIVLRLSYNPNLGDGKPVDEINIVKKTNNLAEAAEIEKRRIKFVAKIASGKSGPFTKFQDKVIDKSCFMCHGGVHAPGIRLLRYDDEGNAQRIIKANKLTEFFSMVSNKPGYPPMPPNGYDSDAQQAEAINLLKIWMDSLGKK